MNARLPSVKMKETGTGLWQLPGIKFFHINGVLCLITHAKELCQSDVCCFSRENTKYPTRWEVRRSRSKICVCKHIPLIVSFMAMIYLADNSQSQHVLNTHAADGKKEKKPSRIVQEWEINLKRKNHYRFDIGDRTEIIPGKLRNFFQE